MICLHLARFHQGVWGRINRSHKSLQLDKISQGIIEFSRTFEGELATETMLIRDINDNAGEMGKIANFISRLKDTKSYVSIPTRPPAEKWVNSVTEHTINTAYQLFKEKSSKN